MGWAWKHARTHAHAHTERQTERQTDRQRKREREEGVHCYAVSCKREKRKCILYHKKKSIAITEFFRFRLTLSDVAYEAIHAVLSDG